MSSKYFLKLTGVFFVFMFLFYPAFALIISEINFDPAGADTDREWVEIYNDGAGTVDLTTYKFYEENVNHGISVLSGDKNISASEYVVLVQDLNKFKIDNPTYTGKIFKSSFSLSNTGESLSLKDNGGNIINTVSYLQATTGSKDGETISYNGITFVKTVASPGTGIITTINNSTTTVSTTTSATSTTTTATDTTATTSYSAPVYYYRSYFPESEKIYLYVGENKVSLSGAQTTFEGKVVNGDKKVISNANYFWSFGDGTIAEGKNVQHTYKYPGEYTVDVEAFANGSQSNDKIYVLVTDPDLKIKINFKIRENENEKVVEIKNYSNNEVDIGGLMIKTSGGEWDKTSTLPKKLLILPKKSVTFSQETLNFATATTKAVLTFSNGKNISEFSLENTDKNNIIFTKNIISQNVASSTSIKVFTKQEYEKNISVDIAPKISTATKKVVFKTKTKILTNLGTTTLEKTKDIKNNNDKFTIGQDKKTVISNIFDFLGLNSTE